MAPQTARARPRKPEPAGNGAEPSLQPVQILYLDGSSDRLATLQSARVLLAIEAEGHDGPQALRESFGGSSLKTALWMAWAHLGRPGKSFDAWIDTVADLRWLDPVPFGSARRRAG